MIVRLRREYGRFLTSGSQLFLVAVGAQLESALGWAICAGLIAVISLLAWMSTYRRARAIDDTPTSKIASAAQGYVELLGRGRPLSGPALESPLGHQPCLWYRYLMERQSDHKWAHVSSSESDASFIIDDGSGECLVDPAGAEILPARKETWTQGDYRYTEWLLIRDETIYALGQFQTINGSDLGFDRAEAVKTLLAQWKNDPQDLLRRFDLDGNGELDMNEWSLARAQAHREVEGMRRDAQNSRLHAMRHPDDGRLYLLSSLPPDKLSRRYRWWSIAHLAIFFGALVGMTTAITAAA